LHPDDSEAQFNLAMAYGRQNRSVEAIAAAEKAIALARAQNDHEAVEQIGQWLQSYREPPSAKH
jgi:Flp pilus assembly protein TadD